MDSAWKFRFVLFIALMLVMIGDFLGYGSVRAVNSITKTSPTRYGHSQTESKLAEVTDIDEFSETAKSRTFMKAKLSEAIKESCLPKMLCEMASKSEHHLSEKERDLLYLIRSSTMAASMNSPTRWHFAAHMGELFKYTGTELSGPMGCANLWPHCPISSKKLMKLTYNVNFK